MPNPSAWSPGFRHKPGRRQDANTAFSNTAFVFAATGGHRIVGQIHPEESDQPGEQVVLSLSKPNRAYSIGLTQFTVAELLIFEEIVTAAIARAKPICQMRDDAVQEEVNNGGTDRSYRGARPDPKIKYFERVVTEHSQGILNGHQDDVSGDESDSDPAG